MKLNLESILGPVIGLLLLVLILNQTASALRSSGAWMRPQSTTRIDDPLVRFDRLLAAGTAAPPPQLVRDPFGYAPAAPVAVVHRVVPRPAPVESVPVQRPVLTSIIWDNDPRATVHWADRDYSVHVNSLFADFRVQSISQDQVVLDRGGESIVLRLPRKGD